MILPQLVLHFPLRSDIAVFHLLHHNLLILYMHTILIFLLIIILLIMPLIRNILMMLIMMLLLFLLLNLSLPVSTMINLIIPNLLLLLQNHYLIIIMSLLIILSSLLDMFPLSRYYFLLWLLVLTLLNYSIYLSALPYSNLIHLFLSRNLMLIFLFSNVLIMIYLTLNISIFGLILSPFLVLIMFPFLRTYFFGLYPLTTRPLRIYLILLLFLISSPPFFHTAPRHRWWVFFIIHSSTWPFGFPFETSFMMLGAPLGVLVVLLLPRPNPLTHLTAPTQRRGWGFDVECS